MAPSKDVFKTNSFNTMGIGNAEWTRTEPGSAGAVFQTNMEVGFKPHNDGAPRVRAVVHVNGAG